MHIDFYRITPSPWGISKALRSSIFVVASAEAQHILSREPLVGQAVESFETLDVALVGIGFMELSRLLASSGNVFSTDERAN